MNKLSTVILMLVLLAQISLKKMKTNTETTTGADTLSNNSSITTGNSLTSANGIYSLLVKSDGNLVVYGCYGISLWDANSDGSTAQRTLIMQSDGNLVLYQSGVSKWSSGTYGKGTAPFRLVMQGDGNLVIYDSTGAATWATNTVDSKGCQLCVGIHDGTNAGTTNDIGLTYIDEITQTAKLCTLTGTKSRGKSYCCTPSDTTYSTPSAGYTLNGKYFLKIQLFGNDEVWIGNVDIGSRHIGYFYDYYNILWAEGQVVGFSDPDALCFARFSLSTGDRFYQSIAYVNARTYTTRDGYSCYYTFSP
jgi:hypothetical protein